VTRLALGAAAGHAGWVAVPTLLFGGSVPVAIGLTTAVGACMLWGIQRRSVAILLAGPLLIWALAGAVWAPTALVGIAGLGALAGGTAYTLAALTWASAQAPPSEITWHALPPTDAPPAGVLPWLLPLVVAGGAVGAVGWAALSQRAMRAYPEAPGTAAAGLTVFALLLGLIVAVRLQAAPRPRRPHHTRAWIFGGQSLITVALWLWWRA
jgi:hypothetical protein